MPTITKRSFALAGHRTSVALEPPFWAAVDAIAAAKGISAAGLVAAVDAARAPGESLASCLRVLALHEANGKNLSLD
jgi:predicted DNA-binding ribbon-helix-helix protein